MLIDITRLALRRARGHPATGVDRVGLVTLSQHRAQAGAVLVARGHSAVLRPGDSQAAFDWLLDSSRPTSATATLGHLVLWWARAQHRPNLRGRVLLNTGHWGLEHVRYAQDLRRAGVQPVYLVHDLIPLTHPEFSSPGEPQRHALRMRHALATASGLVVNSHDTQAQLARHAASLALPMPPTVVAPLAPGWLPAAPESRPLAVPYFVVLGTIEPRKNHLLLLQLWRTLVEKLGDATPHLVVVGRRGWQCQETFNLLDHCAPIRRYVHEVPHCSDAALSNWLHHAQALLFPSFVEGYGMPAVEALTHGLPVIASDLPVLRESVADVPDYAQPLDGTRWLGLVLDHLQPQGVHRQAQLQRMRGFVPPTWALHHQRVQGLLDHLARPSAQPSGTVQAAAA